MTEQESIIIIGIAILFIGLLFYTYTIPVFGAERKTTMTDYVGTSDWLTEVDKCVDLYHETEQNETLYYGCMNNLERDNVHYQ